MSNDLQRNAAFDNIDDLLDAKMDDIDELPPLAVPPTGNYTCEVTIERKEVQGKDALLTSYKVIAVGEVANEEEAGEVTIGQQWQNGCFTKKKDGKTNETGIAMFKTSLRPFAQHFFPDTWGSTSIGEIVNKVVGVHCNITLRRVERKDSDGEYNARIKSVIVL